MRPVSALAQAYEACLYRAYLPGGTVDIRVGETVPLLDACLDAQAASCWAILTAHNPRSEPLSTAENLQRQTELESALRVSGLAFFYAENLDPHGRWPVEVSCLILGCGMATARHLACKFFQNAFVWGERGGRARLVWSECP